MSGRIAIILLFTLLPASIRPYAEEISPTDDRNADWIPAGSVSREMERRAIELQTRLQVRSPGIQREALLDIQRDLDLFTRKESRIATAPLVAELLDMDYSILEMPVDYRVDGPTRLLALDVLSRIGGEEAWAQLRETLQYDSDGTIRAAAAQLLARNVTDQPQLDYEIASRALRRVVRARGEEAEVTRILQAVRSMSERVWSPDVPALLEALVLIHEGRYSSGLRNSAMSFLEELAER